MRHPALTRFFAAFLAVVSAITMISGALCIKKAADSQKKQNTDTERLSDKAAEAKKLAAVLDAMSADFEDLNAAYEEDREQYDADKRAYRKDLSIYTATEGGLKEGQEQLDEGYAALRMGWIQHDNGEKALDEAEAQFQPGYEQYLAGKAQLEEGRRQLEQAEELKKKLPDLALLRTALNAARASSDAIGPEVDAMRKTLQDPPRDPESGQIDPDALRTLLTGHLTALSSRLSGVREATSVYTPEELEKAIEPSAAALNELAARLADGSLSTEELMASAEELMKTGQGMDLSFNEALDRADQTLTMLENLPQMREELDRAQAALDESEPMILEAKKGFEEGRRQLDAAKDMLIIMEAQLIEGKKTLEEKRQEQEQTREDLEERKLELERRSRSLDERLRELEEYREKKDRFSDLRYALLADEAIAARVRSGEELVDGAERELELKRAATQREYALRLAAAVLMLSAALFGMIGTAAAFRDGGRTLLRLGTAFAFALSAAAEGVSLYAGRGLIYTVLFVGIFGALILALNIRKAA